VGAPGVAFTPGFSKLLTHFGFPHPRRGPAARAGKASHSISPKLKIHHHRHPNTVRSPDNHVGKHPNARMSHNTNATPLDIAPHAPARKPFDCEEPTPAVFQGARCVRASASTSLFPPTRFLPILSAPCYVPPRRMAHAPTHHIVSRFGTASVPSPPRPAQNFAVDQNRPKPTANETKTNSNRNNRKDQKLYEAYNQ
jgi:hypothetical protein